MRYERPKIERRAMIQGLLLGESKADLSAS